RGGHDVTVDAHTETGGRVADAHFDIAGRAGVGAGADCVLVVVHDLHGAFECVDKGGDGAVAATRQHAGFAVVFQLDLDLELLARAGVCVTGDTVAHQLPRSVLFQVFLLEDVVHVGGTDFLAGFVGHALDCPAEFNLQAARQHQNMLLLEQVGDAALARLAVDADHRIVAAAHAGRVDRQVGDLPNGV